MNENVAHTGGRGQALRQRSVEADRTQTLKHAAIIRGCLQSHLRDHVGADVDAGLDGELRRMLGGETGAPLGHVSVTTAASDRVELCEEPPRCSKRALTLDVSTKTTLFDPMPQPPGQLCP